MSNDTQVQAHMALVDKLIVTCMEGYKGGFEDTHNARAAVEASARQLAEQPGHLLIAAERWAQLEHMWSRNATPETIASYIGRPEILDRISKIRREHEAAVQGNAA